MLQNLERDHAEKNDDQPEKREPDKKSIRRWMFTRRGAHRVVRVRGQILSEHLRVSQAVRIRWDVLFGFSIY